MKQLQKSDLKEGEIYVTNISLNDNYTYEYLNKHSLNGRGYGLDIKHKNDFRHDWVLSYSKIREATTEEKHWLETCIKADKFVSYEDAMKTFILEYVECTISKTDGFTVDKIYKIEEFDITKKDMLLFKVIDNNQSQRIIIMNGSLWKFKPSTKEAYDAQFKEPEFVLPEEWHIKVNSEEESVIYKKFFKKVKPEQNWKFWVNFVYGFNGIDYNNGYSYSKLITFEQFKQYVLKEESMILEKPKIVFEEPTDKVLKCNQIRGKGTTIVQVECSQGGVYKIGDKIRIFGHSKNPVFRNKQYFTIQSFRWSNDKSKICAVFNTNFPNGIGLDKIELYVEPKFILPEKWCVKFNKEPEFIEWCNKNTKTSFKKFELLSVTDSNYFHYPLNTIQVTSKNPNYTEITFEQFKKYVLKDE